MYVYESRSVTDNSHSYLCNNPLSKRDTAVTVPSKHNMNITAASRGDADTLPQTGQVISWIPELSWTQWR
jgi:hypothetical protein